MNSTDKTVVNTISDRGTNLEVSIKLLKRVKENDVGVEMVIFPKRNETPCDKEKVCVQK